MNEAPTLLIPAVMGLAKLAKMTFNEEDMSPVWQQLTARFDNNAGDTAALLNMCAALMDMSLIDQMLNNAERGLAFQAQALAAHRLYQLPAKASPAGLRVLGIAAAGKINTNTPIEFLIEDTDITLYMLYVAPGLPLPPVPEHDLAFVLLSDSDDARPLLQELEPLIATWPRPVLNLPGLIPQLGRESLYNILAPIPGVEIPATVRADRALWESVGRGEIAIETLLPDGGFPIIARPVDSHAGQGLEKIENVSEVSAYLARRPETEFYLSRFVDYRSPDSLYRKYRVMIIDGKAFPCHKGVSSHWMIHFVNAGMLESAAKRAEEERWMNGFHAEFIERHGQAITEMADATGLDYFGIDCGETPAGKLLIFEADTALVVHNMDSPDIFPYKSPHMLALFESFRAMLYRKSRLPHFPALS